jgi:hypothetical protein
MPRCISGQLIRQPDAASFHHVQRVQTRKPDRTPLNSNPIDIHDATIFLCSRVPVPCEEARVRNSVLIVFFKYGDR